MDLWYVNTQLFHCGLGSSGSRLKLLVKQTQRFEVGEVRFETPMPTNKTIAPSLFPPGVNSSNPLRKTVILMLNDFPFKDLEEL